MNQSYIFRGLFDELIRCSEEELESYESEITYYEDEVVRAKEAIVAFATPYANEQQMTNIKLLVDEIDYLVGTTLRYGADGSVDGYIKYTELRSGDAKKTLVNYVELLIDNAPEADGIWSAYKTKYPNEIGNMRRHLQ